MQEKLDGKEPRSYLEMMQDYNKIVVDLDKPFVWSRVGIFAEQASFNSVE